MKNKILRSSLTHFCAASMLLLFSAQAYSVSQGYQINFDEWARPRSGNLLVEFQALRTLIVDWSQTNNGVIEVYYPGGEMGTLWVDELTDWMVSLGVPSENIVKRAGNGMSDRIDLAIKSN